MLSNLEYFEYFLDFVKKNEKKQILKEFGGANIYIPSYKSILRDEELKNTFTELVKKGLSSKEAVLRCAKEYGLSVNACYLITKEIRAKLEPSLFE